MGRKYSGIHLERALCCRLQDFTNKLKRDQRCVPCINKKSDSNNQSSNTNSVEFHNSSLSPDQRLLKEDKKIEINIERNEVIKLVTNKCCRKEETEEEINLNRCVDDLYYTHHPSMLCTAVKFDISVITTECAIAESTPRADPGYCRKSMKEDESQIGATLQESVEGGMELEAKSGRAVGADFTETRCVCWWSKRKRKRKSNSPMYDSEGGRAGSGIVEDREGVGVAGGLRISLTDKLERKEQEEAEAETEKSGQKDTDNNDVGDVENKKEKAVNTGNEDIFHIHDMEYAGIRGGDDSICIIDSVTGLRSTTGEINGGLEDEIGFNSLNSRDARDCLGRQNDGYGGDIERLCQDRNIDEFGRNGTNENCISKNNNSIRFYDEDRRDTVTNCKGLPDSPHVIKGIVPISSYSLFNDFKMLLKRCLLVQNHWEMTRSGSTFRLNPSSASATSSSSSSSNSSTTLQSNGEYCCKGKSRNERSTNHGSRSRDDYDINDVNDNEKYNSITESELETCDKGSIKSRNRGQSRDDYLSDACGEEEYDYVYDIKEKEKEKGKEDIDGNNKEAEALTVIDTLSMSSSQISGVIDKMKYAHTKCHSLLRLNLSQKNGKRQADDNEIKDEDGSMLFQSKYQAPRVLLKFLVLPANIVNSNNGRLKSIYDDTGAEETVGSLIGYKSERMSLLHPTRAENENVKENRHEREGEKGKVGGEKNSEEDTEDSEDSTISAKRKERDSDAEADSETATETDVETQINVYTSSRNILFSHPKLFPDWIRKADYL